MIQMKKTVLKSFTILCLLSTIFLVSLTNEIRLVEATGTIHIRADGRIEPDTASISTVDNITYTLTDDIYDSIVVERDNIVLDGKGYTVQGTEGGRGIDLSQRSNVTVKRITVKSFEIGIQLHDSSDNRLHQNTVAGYDTFGIMLWPDSNNNIITGNTVLNNTVGTGIQILKSNGNRIDGNTVAHNSHGVTLSESYDNNIQNNTIYSNEGAGIYTDYSGENTIIKNSISNCSYGIYTRHSSDSLNSNTVIGNHYGLLLDYSDGNVIYHNNFINNTIQVQTTAVTPLINDWDDDYPSGGNYWSDYNGTDLYRGQFQNETGYDGIGDTPYTIDANNTDNYPLTHPYGPVRNLNTSLTYLTIQSAISAPETLDGHTILVSSGTYYERVRIGKSLILVGENKSTTIIDGEGTASPVVGVFAHNVTVTGFTVQNSSLGGPFTDSGIYVYNVENTTIADNVISANHIGIHLRDSKHDTICGNTISENNKGITCCNVREGSFIENTISRNVWFGIDLSCSESTSILRNLLMSCSPNIALTFSMSITIAGNTVSDSPEIGVNLWYSNSCSIQENTISNNPIGTHFVHSPENKIHHNNFHNNSRQVYLEFCEPSNLWDDGYPSGGNYWSDYTDVDSDNDGIGDALYVIDENNKDNYPLMGMFSDFNTTSEHHVQTICNSTISDFQFNGTAFSFSVTGEDGTLGFCRACIPTALMNDTYTVFINGTEVAHTLLPCSNSTRSYLYFGYFHSTQDVVIIPELPSVLIVPLLMALTLGIAVLSRKKRLYVKNN